MIPFSRSNRSRPHAAVDPDLTVIVPGPRIIQEAVVIGDGRNYCVALFSLEPETFAEWAQREGIPADPGHERVRAALDAHVKEVNSTLASFESIKYFDVLPKAMSVDGGELTASLKVKRKVVSTQYAAVIEALYAKKPPAGE